MNNKMTDLNKLLFEQIENINKGDLSTEELEKQIKKAEATTKIAETIIKNKELGLKSISIVAQHGICTPDNVTKLLLGYDPEKMKTIEAKDEEV